MENQEIKKEQELNIFEYLKEKNICYSVTVSLMSTTFESNEFSQLYNIILLSSDAQKLDRFSYRLEKEEDNLFLNLIELNATEVDLFNDFKNNDFNKVLHNKYGRTYELKTESFKEHYNNKLRKVSPELIKSFKKLVRHCQKLEDVPGKEAKKALTVINKALK